MSDSKWDDWIGRALGVVLIFMGFTVTSVMLAGLIAAIVLGRGPSFDSTDSPPHRSGMGLHTDAATGCQYLSSRGSSLTPRLTADGKHMGCKP